MNLNTKQKGFTLVELLIVIVVIAILAAISIVAYNGIQNRAKTTSSQTAAETLQKKAEAANAITSSYPDSVVNSGTIPATSFFAQSDSSLSGSGLTIGTPSSSNSPSTVSYQKCTTPASGKPAQQAKIGYYSWTANAIQYNYIGGTVDADCTTWATALSGGPF